MISIIEKINKEIASYRFDVIDEKELQEQLFSLVLSSYGFKREVSLSVGSVIDFYNPELGIGIEVKIKGSKMAIYRQCLRYVKTGKLKYLLVVSAKDLGLWFEDIEKVPTKLLKLGDSLL